MAEIDPAVKNNAFSFLEAAKATLNTDLPPPDHIRLAIRDVTAAAKADVSKAHLRWPEGVFVNQFIVPKLFELMQTVDGIDEAAARHSFLCEGYHNFPQFCSGTPARSELHPFTKIISSNAADVIDKWKGKNGNALTQACPDFAFRDPFPFRVVFEAKYFDRGSTDKAARELAANIYQAFFYRSLPYVAPKRSSGPWDYDFACLLAYDASPAGALLAAWNELTGPVRAGFWVGANLYVMILRPGN